MITDEMVEAAAEEIDPTAFDESQPNHDGAIRQFRRDKALGQARSILEAVEPLIRQQTAEAIAAACEQHEDDANRAAMRAEADGTPGAVTWTILATGYMRSAEIAREYGKGDPNG